MSAFFSPRFILRNASAQARLTTNARHTTKNNRAKNRKKGISNEKFNAGTFLLSLVIAAIMMGYIYVINLAYYKLFDLDLRFIWPFFRPFTFERFIQFLVYIPFFILFYYLNNTKIMRDLRTKATYQEGFIGFIRNWFRSFLLMAGGVIIIVLIEYIPFFAEIGPGADVLFGSTFGGPFMSILILFVPQVMFFSPASSTDAGTPTSVASRP